MSHSWRSSATREVRSWAVPSSDDDITAKLSLVQFAWALHVPAKHIFTVAQPLTLRQFVITKPGNLPAGDETARSDDCENTRLRAEGQV
jgi:hypothetical protein